ncbi:Carbon monoxide dehydrogenase large chain [Thalassovita gelatinovora]|uniref:Carbon monoxide dehydrogenase large chain n=1 Tax=Thalassovita gelatinovora TaxID=53501 RepID=A0A0P1FNU7_THAGE|nr:xanthine dehydrogenase family protein molybdopterin-binding subunit [Thalassovita gelatinovora]QIZ82281.1 xanthine dehydrogenase family protein molybdopterin-binding subunit [Thalassovita gelatinovora]CUH63837.1 Carbon monoxide dehydrogenase large chain [Thalassovita gelatinovora]SEQ96984.1 carbon-monoxide dehydrogenase large subunit [Thalassovita gelatinovora]
MEKFGKSQPIKRVEDVRFLTGHGAYIDDAAPQDALRAVVFRSPVAHAVITSLDVSAARDSDGVHMVLTADDLAQAGITKGLTAVTVQNRDGSPAAAPYRPVLAQGKLRFAGEPVAVVVAETLDQARDAAELIELDYDDLPAKLDMYPGGEALHEEAPDNRAFDWGLGDEAACSAAFDRAAKVVRMEIVDSRIIVNSMEPRGCFADWRDQRLHFAFGGQGVWAVKGALANTLSLDADQVHVTTPDVGGGFGMKAPAYPEYFAVAHAAMVLNRPVRWMGERSDAMLSDHHGRDLVSDAALAFDENNRIIGYRVDTRCNLGAYNSNFGQLMQTNLFARVLAGTYDVQATYLHSEGFYTNTTQVDAYRGAGRPEAIYVLERMMDQAARELGVDPWDLRRINFIPKNAFPYKAATGETYDVGDFNRVLGAAETFADRAGFQRRRAESEARGKLRGIGLSYYIESILGDPSEGAKVEFNADGTVTIYVGTQSNGQGHETVYAKFLSDQTGIPQDRIFVVQGDSDLIAQGGGTGGSRSVTTQANATLATVDKMIAAFTPYLADKMGVSEDDLRFDDETFRAPGSNLTPTLLEAAEMARVDGRQDLLMHEARATLPARSYPNGAHVAEVEIDPDTGDVELAKYTVVDDFGNLINPLLAEGQVHGGVAQGAGQVLMERVVYDDDGQLLSGSFMDYAMPRAADLPMIGFTTEAVPSTSNPMGMKGCGEAGTVGAMASTMNAVLDALWQRGVRRIDMPATPVNVWEALRHAAGKADETAN